MQLRIEGSDLPGRDCPPGGDRFPGYTNVHVAVQRRVKPGELLGLTPGDAPSASWTVECAAKSAAGGFDVTGPYVQGRPGERFLYLSWGAVGADGTFEMFRRAKLMLADVDTEILAAAVRSGCLVARLPLTDAKGNPICARVRPPVVQWSADAPAQPATR